MNNFSVALIVLIAGVNALPNELARADLRNTIINKDNIIEIIKDGIEAIKDAGLDPYKNEGDEYSLTIDYPFPGSLSVNGYFKNFMFTGLSNIVINSVRYDGDILTLDLSLPRLEVAVDEVEFNVVYEDFSTKFEFSGRWAINDIRFVAEVKQTSYGASIEDLNILAWFRTVDSDLNLKIDETDYSRSLNNFLENTIPTLISLHQDELNVKLSKIILQLINGMY